MMLDVIVLGGGAAGLNAALYAARKELSVGIIAEGIGGQIMNTKDVDNYLGLAAIAGYELVERFRAHAEKFSIQWMTGRIAGVTVKDDGTFAVATADGETYEAKTCIIATGRQSRKLGLPGEDTLAARGVSYCATCDGPFYRNKRVVVVGGGDSAVEAAIDLSKVASEVHILIRSRLRADELLVRKMRAEQSVREWHHVIPVAVNGERKVESLTVRNTDTNEESLIETDGVFVEIGGEPNTAFVPAELALSKEREIIVDRSGATNIPGLFAAGDVTDYPQRQIIIAAADGAKAALAAHAFLLHAE